MSSKFTFGCQEFNANGSCPPLETVSLAQYTEGSLKILREMITTDMLSVSEDGLQFE